MGKMEFLILKKAYKYCITMLSQVQLLMNSCFNKINLNMKIKLRKPGENYVVCLCSLFQMLKSVCHLEAGKWDLLARRLSIILPRKKLPFFLGQLEKAAAKT